MLCSAHASGQQRDKYITVPLHGGVSQYSYYYAYLEFGVNDFTSSNIYTLNHIREEGNAPLDKTQRQALIIDTGSSMLSLHCNTCSDCGSHQNQPYDISLSKDAYIHACSDVCHTCHQIKHPIKSAPKKTQYCGFQTDFSEGSQIKGVYVSDRIRFSSEYTEKNSDNHKYISQRRLSLSSLTKKLSEFMLFYISMITRRSNKIYISENIRRQFESQNPAAYSQNLYTLNGNKNSYNTFNNISSIATFGCHVKETHLIKRQNADGIMGLNMNSDPSSLTLPQVRNGTQIQNIYKKDNDHWLIQFANNNGFESIFSICFAHFGGVLTIGGYDENVHGGEIVWLKSSVKGVTALNVHGIGVEKDYTRINTLAIVDSGSTFTYLPDNVYDEVVMQIFKSCADSSRAMCKSIRGPSAHTHMSHRHKVLIIG